jgi:hypothetical protein
MANNRSKKSPLKPRRSEMRGLWTYLQRPQFPRQIPLKPLCSEYTT